MGSLKVVFSKKVSCLDTVDGNQKSGKLTSWGWEWISHYLPRFIRTIPNRCSGLPDFWSINSLGVISWIGACQSPPGWWTNFFRIGNPNLNLHLPQLLGGARTQFSKGSCLTCTFHYYWLGGWYKLPSLKQFQQVHTWILVLGSDDFPFGALNGLFFRGRWHWLELFQGG